MGFIRIYRSSAVGRIADWTSLGQLAVGLASLCGGSALVSWIASTIEPIMQHGWGAVILLGITTTCIIIFTLSIAAFAFRAFFPARHLAAERQATLNDSLPNRRDEIDELLAEFTALKDTTRHNYENFDRRFVLFSQYFERSNDRLGKIEKMLRPTIAPTLLEALGNQLPPATNRFESVRNDLIIIENRIKSLDEANSNRLNLLSNKLKALDTNVSESFAKIRNVIRAQRVLESYKHISGKIERSAEKLSDPLSKTELMEDWRKWLKEYANFRSAVADLERLLKFQAEMKIELFSTPPELYATQNWTYDFSLMDDDQKMEYKTFRIIYRNFTSFYEDLESKLYQATFIND